MYKVIDLNEETFCKTGNFILNLSFSFMYTLNSGKKIKHCEITDVSKHTKGGGSSNHNFSTEIFILFHYKLVRANNC